MRLVSFNFYFIKTFPLDVSKGDFFKKPAKIVFSAMAGKLNFCNKIQI